ncbi:MAG: hypothetical protein V4850_36685 [Myxococcota bacterium]
MTKSYVLHTWQTDTPVARTRFITHALGDVVPVLTTILQNFARDEALGAIIPLIDGRIEPGKSGYLLRANYYIDPAGTPQLSPEVISAIGPGTEPLDALAESFRAPAIGSTPPAAKLEHVYLWCTRSAESFVVTCPEEALTEHLDAAARLEARRREVLGRAVSTDAATGLSHVARATVWRDAVDKRLRLIGNAVERRRMEALMRRFEASQARLNHAYEQFQVAQKELAQQAKETAFLQKLSTVLSLVSTGLELSGPAPDDAEAMTRWNEARITTLRDARAGAARDFAQDLERLRALDARFHAEWARLKVPISVDRWSPPSLPEMP